MKFTPGFPPSYLLLVPSPTTCILQFTSPLIISIQKSAGLNLHIKEGLDLGRVFTQTVSDCGLGKGCFDVIKEQRADWERSDGCGNKLEGEEMSGNFLCCWADCNLRPCSQTFGVQGVSVPFLTFCFNVHFWKSVSVSSQSWFFTAPGSLSDFFIGKWFSFSPRPIFQNLCLWIHVPVPFHC